MSILCKEIKKIIPLIQTVNEDMHRMEHSRSESCLSPERKRNKMLFFFSWLFTWTHTQAWLLNLSHRRNFVNSSLLPWHRCILPPSLLPLFSPFFIAIFSGLFWLSGLFLFYFCFCPFTFFFPPLLCTAAKKSTLLPSPLLLCFFSDHCEFLCPHSPDPLFILYVTCIWGSGSHCFSCF